MQHAEDNLSFLPLPIFCGLFVADVVEPGNTTTSSTTTTAAVVS
jgi:hypothetical protein